MISMSTYSLRGGFNVDAFTKLEALRQRAREEAAQRAQFAEQMRARQGESALDAAFRERELRMREQQQERSQSNFLQEFNARQAQQQAAQQQAAQQLEQRKAEAAAEQRRFEASQEAAEKQRQFMLGQVQAEEERRRQVEEEKAAAKAAEQAEREGVEQVGARTTAIIAERAKALRDQLQETQPSVTVTLEMMRDAMLAETAQSGLRPAEAAAAQRSINQWYNEQLTIDSNKRKEREAEERAADAKRKEINAQLNRDADREERNRTTAYKLSQTDDRALQLEMERAYDRLEGQYERAMELGDTETAQRLYQRMMAIVDGA